MNKYQISERHAVLLAQESYADHTVRVREVEVLVRDLALEGIQVVIPRGTEFQGLVSGGGWRDMIRNLRAFPWYDRRTGWSHAGFLKGARGVTDRGLYGLLRKDRPVVCVGHSLGGALALNIAAILHHDGFLVSQVVTFGAPKTFAFGSDRFDKLGIPTVQWTNPGDPIADLPLGLFGYRHVNEVKTSRDAQGYSISNNHGIDQYAEAFTRNT